MSVNPLQGLTKVEVKKNMVPLPSQPAPWQGLICASSLMHAGYKARPQSRPRPRSRPTQTAARDTSINSRCSQCGTSGG